MRPVARPALTILLLLGFSQGAIALPRTDLVEHLVQRGETLDLLAGDYGVSTRAIRAYNRLSTPVIRPGMRLRIARGHLTPQNPDNHRLVVNLPQRLVFLFLPGQPVQAFPIGPGQPGHQTPRSDFVVRSRERNPTWHIPVSIQRELAAAGKPVITEVAPGDKNPLGHFWIGTSIPSIGLHGTIAPASVYHFRSHGCMRMRDPDVHALFDSVRVGDTGVIIYEPILIAQRGPRILMEANPDVYHILQDPMATAIHQAKLLGLVERIDWARAREVITAGLGVAADVTFDLGKNPPTLAAENWWLAQQKHAIAKRPAVGQFE